MTFKIFTTVLLISTILFSACNQGNSKSNNGDKTSITDYTDHIKKLEQSALASNIVTDTVLLDYRFGMTKEQVISHSEKLYRDKKLKKNYADKYYFEIASKLGGFYKGYLFVDYYEKKMFSIGLTFSDETSSVLVFSALSDLYKDKYGEADYMGKPISDMDLYERYWFKNNLKIRMKSGIPDASVEYIDLRFERQKEIADSTQKANEANKVKSNL